MTVGNPFAICFRFVGLLLVALLLSACGVTRSPNPEAQAGTSIARPDGVARVLDAQGPLVVFEGLDEAEGGIFPDGRIWLLDRRTGETRLLSRPEDFGPYFFASGATFSPDGRAVYTKVNLTDDSDNLYRIEVASGRADFLTDAAALGLVEIREESLRVSPDGQRLAFAAYRETPLEMPQPNGEDFAWLQGVYSLSLEDPAGSLRQVREENDRGLGRTLVPAFDDLGRLQVATQGLQSGSFPDLAADLVLSVGELQALPSPELRRLVAAAAAGSR